MKNIFLVIVTLAFTVSSQAELFNTTFIIPNPYKIDRGGHQTGAAAAWNDQRLAGASFSKADQESVSSSSTTDSTEKELTLYTYQNHGPFGFELSYADENEEFEGSGTESDRTDLTGRVGFKLPTAPMALGLSYSDYESSLSNYESEEIQVSANYEVSENWILGGFILLDKNGTSGNTDKDRIFAIGLGHIADDISIEGLLYTYDFEDSDTDAFLLLGQVAKNIGENQTIGNIIISRSEGNGFEFTSFSLGGGYHFSLSDGFYIQPHLGISRAKYEYSSSSNEDDSGLDFGVEGGIRAEQYNFYVAVDKEESNNEVGSTEFESDIVEFKVGAHFYF